MFYVAMAHNHFFCGATWFAGGSGLRDEATAIEEHCFQ
jgi:hypothetical protein